MITKKQSFEVVLNTADEELDGENLIDVAVSQYLERYKKTHIKSIVVNSLNNEWDDCRE